MGKMIRNFVVTKQPDNDHRGSDEEVGTLQEEPTRARYITRILFVLLLITGATLICSGVTLLVMCRNKVTQQTCQSTLFTEPCSDLAVSAYFGCVLILATIFGFGCVGRKAMAVMLVPLVIGEVVFGIYMLTVEQDSVDSSVMVDLSTRKSLCFAEMDNRTTGTTHRVDVFHCWKERTHDMSPCGSLWASSVFDCGTDTRSATLDLSIDNLMQNCSRKVDIAVSTIVWNKILVAGPVLIVHAQLHLAAAICLWFLRRSTSFKRGLGFIQLPNLPKKISRSHRKSWQHAKCGTSKPDQCDQSLIYNEDTVANMQKYVFKKLRRQKNTYATV